MGRALALSMILTCFLAAQDPATFKSGISLVELDASVFDERGIIEGLKQQDFLVKDDHQPVALRYCVQENSPLDLVLLFELTSMMKPNRIALRGAAEVAMAAARQGDRVAVMTYNDGVRLELPVSSDLKEVNRRVRSGLAYATFEGRPFVLSAVAEATKYLATQPTLNGRRAILMFGANTGFGLGDSHAGTAANLWGADTILAGVVTPTSWTRLIYDSNPYHILGMMNSPKLFPRDDYIDDVAANTGGEMIYVEDAGPIKQTRHPYPSIQQSVEHMRRRYRLYYDMPQANPGDRRHVQIELSPAARQLHPGARIIAPAGYVIPKTSGL